MFTRRFNLIRSSRSSRRHVLPFLPVLVCMLLPIGARAQVTFNGVKGNQYVNFGSRAIGSRSATISLPFSVGSKVSTSVGHIAVLTTGVSGKDFAEMSGTNSCSASTYSAATNCVVNVSFDPTAPGMRLGAVVFYSGASRTSAVLASVPVYGIGTGPELVFGPGGARSDVGGKFISPAGIAVDAAADLFVTDLDDQKLFKVTPAGVKTTVGTFEVPQAVAVDGAGNLYVADSEAASVFKVTPGGVQTTVGTGFSYPNGIAVDGQGNLYVTDPFIDEVVKISPAGTQSNVGSGYNTPAGVAVDDAGNAYVADTFNQTVFKVTPGGTQTMLGKDLVSPAAVAVDAAGDVYVTDDGADAIFKILPNGVQETAATGLDDPNGVALDGAANLYVANTYSSRVIKIERAAPPSLEFDSTKMGSTSKDSPKTVDLENAGNSALKFTALSYPADFPKGEADGNCSGSTSLGPASTCALTIEFKPVSAVGLKAEAVKFTTNTLNVKTTKGVDVSGTETAK